MAGRGPAPKPPAQRRHRASAGEQPPRRKLTAAPAASPAAIPPLPGSTSFLAATRRWYRTWATSPQASRFLPTDWQRLHMLAPLIDAYWREPNRGLLAEIRLNEASLGATEADRLRLRWDVEPSRSPAVSSSTSDGSAREATILKMIDGRA